MILFIIVLSIYAISSFFGTRLMFNGNNEVFVRETFKRAIWISLLVSVLGFIYMIMLITGKMKWNVKELKLQDSRDEDLTHLFRKGDK